MLPANDPQSIQHVGLVLEPSARLQPVRLATEAIAQTSCCAVTGHPDINGPVIGRIADQIHSLPETEIAVNGRPRLIDNERNNRNQRRRAQKIDLRIDQSIEGVRINGRSMVSVHSSKWGSNFRSCFSTTFAYSGSKEYQRSLVISILNEACFPNRSSKTR
jgi:hypothetical protein